MALKRQVRLLFYCKRLYWKTGQRALDSHYPREENGKVWVILEARLANAVVHPLMYSTSGS